MRTFIKIGAVIACAALLCMLAIAIFAKIVITPERVRETVLPVASKALKRDVQLGDVSISIFSGINLHNLQVKEPDGKGTFIKASRASLSYRLIPLLSLQVVIDEIRLEQPHISVERLPDGNFNFSDLIPAEDTPDSGEKPSAVTPSASAQSAAVPVNLTIAAVTLNNGTILFKDATVNPASQMQHTIKRLNAQARSITLDDSFPFTLSCEINGAPLDLEGRADISRQDITAEITLKNLNATKYLPYAADALPGSLTSLNVNLSTQIHANREKVNAEGTLALNDINLTLDDLSDSPVQDANLRLDFDVIADLTGSLLRINSSRIDFNEIIAEATGIINQLDTEPHLMLDINLPDIEIPTAIAALPAQLVKDIQALEPTGILVAGMRLEGNTTQGAAIVKSANIRLNNLQATAGSLRPGITGILRFADEQLTTQDLFIKTPGGRIDVDLAARNLFSTPITVKSTLSADTLDLDKLLQQTKSVGTNTSIKNSAQLPSGTPAREPGPFDLPVRADGSVQIARLMYKGLPINTFNLVYRLADNILTIDEMTGQTAEGSFRQTGSIDLGVKGLAYKSSLSVQNLQTDPLIAAFIPKAAQTIFGNLNLEINAEGTGTLPENLKQNLTCLTTINLDNGRISGANLSKSLANFLDLDELRDLHFNSFNGSIDIKQGRAQIDTKLDGSDIRMSQKGTVGLDGILDLSLNTSLGPELMKRLDKRGNVAAYLTDKDGWGQLPLTLGGTLTQPRFSIHAGELIKQTEKTVIETLQNKLLEKIEGKQLDDADNMTEEEKQAKKERKKARKKARKERKAAKKKNK